MELELSNLEARRFLLRYQGLDAQNTFRGLPGISAYVRRVGCLQYDPLDVVGRNADLVLQSRVSGYRRPMLDKLLYQERSLLDGWDKMASIHPTEDWPHFARVRQARTEDTEWVLARRNSQDALSLTDEVLEALRGRGPMLSTALDMGKADAGSWGHRNLSGATMDYLFVSGRIGIHSKRGTQRVYDLIDRLLPPDLLEAPDPFADEADFHKWYVHRRIGSVGLLWNRNGGGWLGRHLENKTRRTETIRELASAEELACVHVEGESEPFWMRAVDVPLLEGLADVKPSSAAARVIAPLDNLIWDRDMTRRLFGFDYSWEVYVPVHKRRFGYYVLPVLLGERFVGRFEPEPQRGDAPMRIRRWWWEPDMKVTRGMRTAVEKGLQRFAAYLGTEWDGVQPTGWQP